MTIMQLRRLYPHHDFTFFKDDKEMQKAPFIHTLIKGFTIVNENTIFVDL